ncbi:sensor histidine kinase [Streptomyces sp. TR02-1]|uniref:sensor histidine kinase n=1 Tax=Streptomyces sp. TR02-1 TaxID=3385977 RepID=UPI0039A1D102
MSVPATPRSRRNAARTHHSPAGPLLLLLVAAVVGAAATAVAPPPATGWVLAVVAIFWPCLAAAVIGGALLARNSQAAADTARREARTAQRHLTQLASETGQLLQVTLPVVRDRLGDGAGAEEILAAVSQPSDPQLRRLFQAFVGEMSTAEQRATSAAAAATTARVHLEQAAADLERLTSATLPAAFAGLRGGASADTVMVGLERPQDGRLRALLDTLVREFATSERRAAAAQGASAKALSRVQAKAVSMLADLREMQDRHGEEVFGDLLRLDHNTSQLGLMTDRLALLMGGRTSRSWNKPIRMESILRGAMGRIAAYQRVRVHCSSRAAVAGFAAESVMHLLAELMDNAANFSPPIDEVHVYVEERSAGIVVTIEDSGLKMADAAMRRAEEAVSGRVTDLAELQGTRLGLAVVGRIAAKYRMSVNFRPSSRGGTGVVVLFPPQLLAQRRPEVPEQSQWHATDGTLAPAEPTGLRAPVPDSPPAAAPPVPSVPVPQQTDELSTPGGLPVRRPGRTMAAAEQEQLMHVRSAPSAVRAERSPDETGARFGAFHRARRSTGDGTDEYTE